jgi:hypothetical protein
LNLEQFVGWKLEEARAALERGESTRSLAVRLIETAAPLRKNQNIEEQEAKLGDWRVLRAQLIENEIEIVVAREQILD